MAVSVTECSAFLFEKNLAPRSLKPGSADWLIVGRAVQIQSPQLCGSKPNSAQFKHAHAQHTQHTHTKHLKRALLFSSERYRADEGVCVCVFVYTRESTARFLSKEQFLYSFLPHERVQGRVKAPDETSSRPHRSAAAQQH